MYKRQLQRARRSLTPAQLDAEPPAASRPTPRYPTAEATSVLHLERTSIQQVPTELLTRPRPFNEPPVARPPRRRRSRRPLIWTSVVAALLVLVGGATYFLSGALYTTVPSVLGQSQAQAVTVLDGAGLQGTFAQQFSETVPNGQVIATDPGVGARVRKSDPVKVTLSKGPERIPVPNLLGLTLDQATQSLTAARLAPGTTSEEYSDSISAGAVISSSPGTGKPLPVNSPVSLVVSKGMTPVPNVVGLSKDDATKALADAGFQLQTSGITLFGTGKATTQTPAAGQPRPQGTTVSVTFSLF